MGHFSKCLDPCICLILWVDRVLPPLSQLHPCRKSEYLHSSRAGVLDLHNAEALQYSSSRGDPKYKLFLLLHHCIFATVISCNVKYLICRVADTQPLCGLWPMGWEPLLPLFISGRTPGREEVAPWWEGTGGCELLPLFLITLWAVGTIFPPKGVLCLLSPSLGQPSFTHLLPPISCIIFPK